MSKHGAVSLPFMRRQCGTCNQWQGERSIELQEDNKNLVSAEARGGMCRDGAWRNFNTLPCQTCDQYQRWNVLLDEPSDPVVLSKISQLHREIRMQSRLAEPLPQDMCEKIDELLWDIERWQIQRQLASSSQEEQALERFFNRPLKNPCPSGRGDKI